MEAFVCEDQTIMHINLSFSEEEKKIYLISCNKNAILSLKI